MTLNNPNLDMLNRTRFMDFVELALLYHGYDVIIIRDTTYLHTTVIDLIHINL